MSDLSEFREAISIESRLIKEQRIRREQRKRILDLQRRVNDAMFQAKPRSYEYLRLEGASGILSKVLYDILCSDGADTEPTDG